MSNFPENQSDQEDQKEITFGESTTQKKTKTKDVYAQVLDVPIGQNHLQNSEKRPRSNAKNMHDEYSN